MNGGASDKPPAMARDNWGTSARFGIFIVSAEVVPEAEWWAMAPEGVSIHAARISAPAPWAPWDADRRSVTLSPDLARGAAHFASMGLSTAVIAHSSSSVVGGEGWDAAVTDCLLGKLRPGTQVTTNGTDCLLALRASGVQKPFLVFPPWFGESVVSDGVAYFRRAGLDPAGALRADPGAAWAGIAPGELYGRLMHVQQDAGYLYDQIVAECPPEADGVMIIGTGVRCVGLIAGLEQALDRPVVTANQASLWRCLRLTGVTSPVTGYGRLFGLACPEV